MHYINSCVFLNQKEIREKFGISRHLCIKHFGNGRLIYSDLEDYSQSYINNNNPDWDRRVREKVYLEKSIVLKFSESEEFVKDMSKIFFKLPYLSQVLILRSEHGSSVRRRIDYSRLPEDYKQAYLKTSDGRQLAEIGGTL